MSYFQPKVTGENREQGRALQRRLRQGSKISGRKITGLQGKRFVGSISQALHLNHAAVGWQREPGCDFRLVINDLVTQKPRAGRQATAGHLFRVAHQPIEVNFWRRHERPSAATPMYYSLFFQRRQSMPCGHQAYLVNPRQLALGVYCVANFQMAVGDSLQDRTLNSLVSWYSALSSCWHGCWQT